MCVLLQCAVLDILVLNFPTAIVVSNNFPATTVLLRLIDGTSHVKRSCIPCYESFFFSGSIQFLLCYFISLIITIRYAQCFALKRGPVKQESIMLHGG